MNSDVRNLQLIYESYQPENSNKWLIQLRDLASNEFELFMADIMTATLPDDLSLKDLLEIQKEFEQMDYKTLHKEVNVTIAMLGGTIAFQEFSDRKRRIRDFSIFKRNMENLFSRFRETIDGDVEAFGDLL